MIGSAVFSECGTYRYSLSRTWDDGRRVCFVMLNPSAADAEKPDPTITRCIGYAKALGAGTLEVVNLFALRSTDPAWLALVSDPVGPRNDASIAEAAETADMIICAWGANQFAKPRAKHVLGLLKRPMCLRKTKGGHPSHPLYLPATLRPVPMQ